jgi:hypothetical protein
MPRAERERDEDLAPAVERAIPSPVEAVAAMPAAVLRMQATAGNRATSDLLARAPAAKEKPKAAYSMSIPKVGDFPVLSLVLPNNDRDDIHVTLSQADGAKFQGPGLNASYPTVTIKAGAVTITLTDVLISGYTLSGGSLGEEPLVELSLNAAKREFK